ncbi:MAG: 4'-phosphopantetheinyl transferase superfamily protein [Lachnospiraceae bacterium]|nr:4'-phosphopantetheinyl transferase superfamily protein [Lachnospiraceae bacterium]
MYERRYLMSVRELTDDDCDKKIWDAVMECIDGDRIKKLEKLKASDKRAASAGGGILLQWAFLEWETVRIKGDADDRQPFISPVNLLNAVRIIKSGINLPRDFKICYGQHGKPYIKERPFFYNISHSGDYVFCAVSDREIGVDIQKKVPADFVRLAERFFSDREAGALRESSDDSSVRELFYRLWTRKEALGKLTGEGLAASADKCVLDFDKGIGCEYIWEEYNISPDYNIVCCRDRYPDMEN